MADETPLSSATVWYASRGVWGSILAAIVPLAGLLLHVNITDAQIQEIATDAAMIGGAVAGLVALYGRIRATGKITLTPKPAGSPPAGNS